MSHYGSYQIKIKNGTEIVLERYDIYYLFLHIPIKKNYRVRLLYIIPNLY